MSFEFKLPELGEGVESAEVAEILVSEGDEVEAEQPVMELETDKAVAELPCPQAGTIEKINVSEGDTVKVGQLILTLRDGEDTDQKDQKPDTEQKQDVEQAEEPERSEKEEGVEEEVEDSGQTEDQAAARADEEEAEREEAEAEKPEGEAEEPVVEYDGADDVGDDEVPEPAGPATRRLARSLDVDLEQIEGSGPGGRITQEDVVRNHDAVAEGTEVAVPELPDFSRAGPIRKQQLSRIERVAAENLSQSWRLIPHVTQHALADVTQLDQDRREYNDSIDDSGRKISLTALAVKAAVAALQDFPRFNASIDTLRQEIIVKEYFHIGVAAETDEGLVVPVVRHAEEKSVSDIAEELEDLVDRARAGKLTSDDMQGATFTISNQGPVANSQGQENGHHFDRMFTPIIPWPQAAILGISGAQRAVSADDQSQSRQLLPLSLSYDHRINNGADAVRFMGRLCELFGGSFQLLVDL